MDDRYLRNHREELNASNAVITPICIVVDTSHSMVDGRFVDRSGKTRMQRLNDGISQFLDEIKKDDMLSDSVEIAIVTFNTEAGVALAFSTIDRIDGIDITGGASSGDTPKGVELGLELLLREKQLLSDNHKRYHQPWIVIMSDGRATPRRDPSTGKRDFSEINYRLDVVQRKTKELESNKKLTVIPVLISETSDRQYDAAKRQMQGFTIENRCKEIGDGASQVSFKDFFKILSRSVSVSNAEVVFTEGIGKSKVYRPATDDYVSQADVARFFQQEPPQKTYSFEETNTSTTEDADEVTRLSKEARVAKSDDFDEVDTEEAGPVASEIQNEIDPEPVPKKDTQQDDAYLISLLEGLDDWDKI